MMRGQIVAVGSYQRTGGRGGDYSRRRGTAAGGPQPPGMALVKCRRVLVGDLAGRVA